MVTLREATSYDIDVLETWDKQQHVIDSDPYSDWEWAKELARHPAWREQRIAELDGKPIGFLQIIDPAKEESHYWGSIEDNLRAIDIWIGEPQYLNKGYGTEMMTLALISCFSEPKVTAVIVDPLLSNHRAHNFYQRLGFKPIGEYTLDDDLCLVHRLERIDFVF